ncbi:MAG: hypothetical protein K2M19_03465 [Muribaculaceae bacterium]|nr:hypothetical protein [Muribaculaceae bacterium]
MKKIILASLAALTTAALPAQELSEWKSAKFDDPVVTESGNIGTDAPFNSGYANTISQLLYTEPQLQGLVKVENGTQIFANIKSFDFAVPLAGAYCNNYFYEVTIDFNVKVSTSDATEFRKDPKTNKRLWFTQDAEAVTGSGTMEYNEDNYPDCFYGEPMVAYIHVDLDDPILYTGGSLLLTFESQSSDPDVDVIGGCAGFKTGTRNMLSGGAASNLLSLSQMYATEPQYNDDYVLPVIKFYYEEVADQTKVDVISIENAQCGVRASEDGSHNILTLDFDIEDSSDCQEYEVLLGTVSLGKVASRHVTVSYLENYATAQTFTVQPLKEGVIGASYVLEPLSYAGFFKEASMQTVKTRAYAQFKAWDSTSKEVGAAAQVKYELPEGAAPVVQMTANPGAGVNAGTTDWCNDFATASSDLTDFKANQGLRSFYQSNLWQSVPYRYGRLNFSGNGSLTLNCGVRYPVGKLAVPVVTADEPEATVTNIEVPVKSFSPRIDPTAEGVLMLDVEYHDVIDYIDEGDGEYTFIAPAGHSILFRFVAEPSAARVAAAGFEDYEDAGGNIYVHNFAENGKGTLYIASTDPEGNIANDMSYKFADNGITGISDICADSEATPAEYFNLQGIRVQNPEGGIFIRRQGGKTAKVIR